MLRLSPILVAEFFLRWLRRLSLVIGFFFVLGTASQAATAATLELLPQINHVVGTGTAGFSGDGAIASAASIDLPQGVAVDGGGNLYIADTVNNRIRRVDRTTGLITTVAGGKVAGYAGDGGQAVNAELNQPKGLAVDPYGNIWIADTGNSVIRKISGWTGTITTVAGDGVAGYAGDGSAATAAELNLPVGVAVDASGNLFIADTANNRVRRVDATTGTITLYAGNGSATYNGDGISATAAAISAPQGVAVNAAGDVYLTDTGDSLVREIVAGNIQIIAGVAGSSGYSGDGGAATSAEVNAPTGLALDASGNLYIADAGNARVREVAAGTITTLAGTGTVGFNNTDGALATTAELNDPDGIAVDSIGEIYIADMANNAVRVISDGRRFPAAALALGTPVVRYLYVQMDEALNLNTLSISGAEGAKTEFALSSVSAPPAFSIGALAACVANGTNYALNAVCIVPVTYAPVYPGMRTASLSFATSVGTVDYGLSGIGQGPESVLTPGVISTILPLLTSSPSQPTYEQLTVDPQGDVFVADKNDNEIFEWCAGVNSSISCTSKGTHNIFIGASGAIVTATLDAPMSVALDAAGDLFIANSGGNDILRVDSLTHAVTTVAGNGTAGDSGDGNLAINAELHTPDGIAATPDGTLYIADTGNNVVRKVDATTGIITTVAGVGGVGGGYGDGGLATTAALNNPVQVALDSEMHLYIADTANSVIRMVDPVTQIIRTVAGENGQAGFAGDVGPATSALLATPLSMAVDAAGNIYIADAGNARIRRVNQLSGYIETIAGSNHAGFAGDGGAATSAELLSPSGVGVDAMGQVIVADQTSGAVRSISAPLPAPLTFQNTTVGCGISPEITVELANIGNEELSLSSLSVPTDFSLANVDSHTCVANAQQFSGSVCDLNFVFAPTVPGNLQESASVTDNSLETAGSIQGISLNGVGQPLNVVPTTMTVTAAPTSSAYGSPILLTATVTSTQGPVTSGTVLFSVNGVEVGSSALNQQGVATETIPAGPTGTNVMVLASHGEQCSYGASAAQTTINVTPAATAITLITSATQVAYGQPVTLEAIVTAVTSGTPTGLVNIMDGTAQIGQATLDATGYATIVLNQQALPLGANTFTAVYLGDPNFTGSTSNAVVVNVYDAKLTMSIHPNVVLLSPASSATIQVTLTPINGFDSPVTLSCAGLIAGATCTFSPAVIQFTSQTQAQQITLTIQSNILVTAGIGGGRGKWSLLGWLLLALTLLAASLLQRARKQSALHGVLYVWMLLAVMAVGTCASLGLLSGCSGGGPKTPYAATVTVEAFTPAQGILAEAPFQLNLAQSTN